MKRIALSAFIVLSLISIDVTISMAYAKSKTTIYKVTKVSSKGKLKLRAWPSNSSRVKVSMPYNAKDLTETGKQKRVGKSKWVQVNWQGKKGWVNARYLKKTGVLLHAPSQSDAKIAKKSSRNTNSVKRVVTKQPRTVTPSSDEIPPRMEDGDRYSEPTQIAAREVKTAFQKRQKKTSRGKTLRCIGSTPQPWNIKLDVAAKKMSIKIKNSKPFSVPINYHNWESSKKVRMSIGSNKGRNIVDVNLEKTNACSTGLSRTNYLYEVNAKINSNYFSGCCEVAD